MLFFSFLNFPAFLKPKTQTKLYWWYIFNISVAWSKQQKNINIIISISFLSTQEEITRNAAAFERNKKCPKRGSWHLVQGWHCPSSPLLLGTTVVVVAIVIGCYIMSLRHSVLSPATAVCCNHPFCRDSTCQGGLGFMTKVGVVVVDGTGVPDSVFLI